MFEGKNILVTGASGLIGYNLVKRLIQEENISIYALGRSVSKMEHTFEEFAGAANLHLYEYGQVIAHMNEYPKFDYIYHAAGPMEPDIVVNRPVDVIEPNIIDLHTILEHVVHMKQSGHDCRLIIFSSVTVYQNNTDKDLIVSEANTNCGEALNKPKVSYSESKRMCEVMAQAYIKQYGVDAVITRFSTVYGPTKNIPNTAFYSFVQKALRGEDIVLNGVGLPPRDNIYVDDAINGLLTVADKGITGEAYNISSNCELGNFMAVDDIAKTIKTVAEREFGMHISVIVPPFDKRKPGLFLDNTKLRQLGWSLTYSMIDGVTLTMRSIKRNE